MKKVSRILALCLALALLVGAVPAVVAGADEAFSHSQLSVVTDKASTLAPGVTQNAYTVYDKNGSQVKMFVTTADMSVDSVKLFASYKDMNPTNYGMSKLTEQVAAFDKKAAAGDSYYQGTVVAGINASYYNMTTGKPSGPFVMNGIDVTTGSDANTGYFAVMKDGSVKIGKPGDYATDKGNIQEAIGIHTMLIIDGQICSGLDATTKYPRQTIGITAEGKVILMTADGSQAPTTVGLTVQEQAQVMMDLGCVWAGHLDGGGSATYASKPEGSNEFGITSSPSDGSERSVSNGFIIVSTAVASYEFDHVAYETENNYLTPGASVQIMTSGVSSTGHAAAIPASVTYKTVNGTYENGLFTAGNQTGPATVTAMLNGKAVGTATVNVVLPDSIAFQQSEMVVPYGKTVDLVFTATYGINPVTMKTDDVAITFSNPQIGAVKGWAFTAAEEGVAANTSAVTVTVVGTNVSHTANITLGKGSEVLYDFEDGEIGNWQHLPWSSTPQVGVNAAIVTAENGQVHGGKHALALDMDFTQQLGTGYMMSALYFPEDVHIQNALRVGMWVYLPDEFVGLYARYCAYSGPYDPNNAKTNRVAGGTFDVTHFGTTETGFVYLIEEAGWYYFSLDISKYPDIYFWKDARCMEFYTSDRDGSDFGYTYVTSDNKQINTATYGRYTLYLDEITVDYSAAVDDREAPIFGNVSVIGEGESSVKLDRLTQSTAPHVIPEFTANTLTISAAVAEDTALANATGLNAASAQCFVDGVPVDCKFVNGAVVLDGHTFDNGVHTLRFLISDNAGNTRAAVRKIRVNGTAQHPTVQLVPRDPKADRIPAGSLYYMDLVASDLADVQEVYLTLDLNSVSTWALEGMEVAPGFAVEDYTFFGSEDSVKMVISRVSDAAADTNVLASIPVRAWYHAPTVDPVSKWKGQAVCPVDVRVEIDCGILIARDHTQYTFTSDRIRVDTEIYGSYAVLNANGDYANKSSWHVHAPVAMADKAATCTTAGYTGRTFCAGCNSVVEWGTLLPATGHSYEEVNGLLQCACGEKLTGIHTDGKTYADGLPINGWQGDSHYTNGVLLTGVQLVDGYYYNFGETGVCAGKAKYTGLFYDDAVKAYRFSKIGVLTGGWNQIDGNWHYFKQYTKVAATGEYAVNGVTFQFDETGKTAGAWHVTEVGTRYYYGPFYYVARSPGYMTLVDIGGKTYNFDTDGYLTYGVQALRDSTSFKKYIFDFGTDGALQAKLTQPGIITLSDGTYFVNNEGYVPMNAGVIRWEGSYYYVVSSGKIKMNGNQTVTAAKANGLLEPGVYYFGADGRIASEQVDSFTGIGSDGMYYENGSIKGNKGLIEIDGDLYFVCYSGKIKKNGNQTITEANANGLLAPGVYYFGADGKADVPKTTFTGIGDDGMYYENGSIKGNKGLIEIDGDLYFVCYSGKIKKNGNQTITEANANGLLAPGVYYFGADGKADVPKTTFTGIGDDGMYYENGSIKGNKGLIEIDGDLYFVCYSGKIKKNGNQTITEANANGLLAPGVYYFGADGKADVPKTAFTGIGDDGYYYENGAIKGNAGLIIIDGDYYFVAYSGKIKKNASQFITQFTANGLVQPGTYYFDADGKMAK